MLEIAKPFLYRPGTTAHRIPHPRYRSGFLSVRRHKDDWFACDPNEGGTSISLTRDDIVNWSIDWDRLGSAYRDALGLQRLKHTPTNSSGWRHIGTIQRDGGACDTVTAVIASDPATYTRQINDLLHTLDVSAIMSVARLEVDESLHQVALRNQVQLLQLTDLCVWQQGTLTATTAWQPIRRALQRRRTVDATTLTSPRSMERDGACWRFSFEGESVVVKDHVGAEYIRHLLQLPHKRVGVLDLLGVRDPVRAELIRKVPRERGEDDDKLEQTPEFKSVVISVRQGIIRTLKEIKEQSPLLYAHFREHLHTGMVCTYSPPPGIDWELQ